MKTLRFILGAIVLMASTALFAQSKGEMPFTSSSPEAAKMVRQAWVLFCDAKFDEGGKLIEQALEKDPDCGMANLFKLIPDEAQRMENYKRVETLRLSADEKLYLNGVMASHNKKPEQEFFAPLMKKYPKDDYLHMMMIFNTRDPKQRAAIGEAVIKRNPKFTPVYNLMGYTYMDLKEMSKAEASFNKYMALRPELANVYDSKGDYFDQLGNYNEAAASFEKAASMGMAPSSVKAQRAAARTKYPKLPESDIEEIKKIISTSSEEYVKENTDVLLNYYADQSVEIYGNQIANVGKPNIRMGVTNTFKNGSFTRLNIAVESTDGIGKLAFAWGASESIYKPTSGEANENKENVIFLFRKQADGNWKILADHFFAANQPESEGDAAAIRQVVAKWEGSVNSGKEITQNDLDKLTSFYSTQAIEILPGQRSVVGLGNIQVRQKNALGIKYEINSLEPARVEVIGKRGVAWGLAVQNLYRKGSTELTKVAFAWSMIFTKEQDDQWRILAIHWYSE